MSRVGGAAQVRALRTVSGRLRLDLAQFRELEAFSAFGSDLDRASKRQLERGARLVELLKQPQSRPFPVERQVVSIWAGTTGALDDIPVADIHRFEADSSTTSGATSARSSTRSWRPDLEDDTVARADEGDRRVQEPFQTHDGAALHVEDDPRKRSTRPSLGQEKIVHHAGQATG